MDQKKEECDSDWIEEEALVYVDLESLATSKELKDPGSIIKLIGLDEENPIMQLNEKYFKGMYTNAHYEYLK